ncbi:hypothetical protein N7516_003204 [Penicillium verrucosum]|uniref:uncharacterized protein n=1 Tax=Penicillium verrucosum TaxID=60171 RepID=UPI00254574D0|nr:uncharacterized protein N7516_003204 [Penicillium verrucosum]KAJ5943036.1 hypothetical protein N7516_003204 [Penicillium verrucosum]
MQLESDNSFLQDQDLRSETNHSQAPATHRRPGDGHDAAEVISIVPGTMIYPAQLITPAPR